MSKRPIKSVIGVTERHKCRRCWRTLPHDQFKPIIRDGGRTKYQMLHPHCRSCVQQLAGEWVNHPLYSMRVDARMRDLVAGQKSNARQRGLVWAITKDDVLGTYIEQEGKCAMTGQMLNLMTMGGKRDNKAPSIDRIDSSCGYIPGNIQLVCAIVNIMKNDMTYSEFVRQCSKIVDYQVHRQTELLDAIEQQDEDA